MRNALLLSLLCAVGFASEARAVLRIDYSYVDMKSNAYKRFKTWVDDAVAGRPGYAFSASDAAILFKLTSKPAYCELAVKMIEAQVTDAEARISAAQRPAVAGDSYLEAGPMISALALTMDACGEKLDDSQRKRWSDYAEKTISNIWNPKSAHWGETPAQWTGWSIDNPGNNYYYSFVEATMHWALLSENEKWLRLLRDDKLPALKTYFSNLPGGGSLEGTGYGAAHMRLFALYRVWKDSTGVDLANANPHVSDSIRFWINATVPTLDRFAPIGDQSRVSVPELYDYHRRLVLEARADSNDESARNDAAWWLSAISVKQMTHGFNSRYDMLPAGKPGDPPTALTYLAKGTGHIFTRTSWDKSATWLSFTAGPYRESHAHQDQGSFTLFAGDWLAVTENIWSHSGIQQGTDVHNIVRFVRDGKNIRQREGTTSKLELKETGPGAGEIHAIADLSPAYAENSGVDSWVRDLRFVDKRLTIHDRFAVKSGTRAIFQINVPVKPEFDERTASAGKLRIKVLQPEDAKLTALDWSSVDSAEFRSGWRIDIEGSGNEFVVELVGENR